MNLLHPGVVCPLICVPPRVRTSGLRLSPRRPTPGFTPSNFPSCCHQSPWSGSHSAECGSTDVLMSMSLIYVDLEHDGSNQPLFTIGFNIRFINKSYEFLTSNTTQIITYWQFS